MSQPLDDHRRALDLIDRLLAARPDLRSTLESLYAKAWPDYERSEKGPSTAQATKCQTVSLLAALASTEAA